MHTLLDVAKIADSLVFVLDSTEAWDSYGDYCLSCLFAQGLPSHGGYKPELTAQENLTSAAYYSGNIFYTYLSM